MCVCIYIYIYIYIYRERERERERERDTACNTDSILNFADSQEFQHKTISRSFVQLTKKLSYFCPLELIRTKNCKYSLLGYRNFQNLDNWTTGN